MHITRKLRAYVALAALVVGTLVWFRGPIIEALNPPTPLPSAAVADPALVGHYYDGDGLGVNLTLNLHPDGTFQCSWTGCLGDYGSTAGKWGRIGQTVHISVSTSQGMFTQKPLQDLKVTDSGSTLFGYNGFSFAEHSSEPPMFSPVTNAGG
ncbi:hypothetical protein Poly51_59010 [Rubripirellula tenax]|uniref:Uncharacterized protein n=1 Tax=Rubripirellula tenax TaxID=2528015 RepID=A0A5C6E6R7_9BACT|nr:hypothetical protein [Rubripirellula tenax]TWU44632.1 hypothetical protein Poly51_59010 [Rubripirellula tenax]